MVDRFLSTSADVAEAVRAQRAVLRLTQQQVADRARVSRRFVRDLEAGHPRAELDKTLAVLHAVRIHALAIPAPPPPKKTLRTFDYDAYLISFSG